MPKPTDFRETIRRAIKSSGLTLRALAAASGVHETTLSRYLGGKGISAANLEAVCKALGLRLTPAC